MTDKLHILLIFSTLLLFSSCSGDKDPSPTPQLFFKDYYYPIDDLFEGKFYVYTPVNNDSIGAYFWYYKMNSGYLTGTKYDSELKIEQITSEDILRNGTRMNRIQLCDYLAENPDLCEAIVPKIEAGAVFPFEMYDSTSVFLYKVRWKEPTDTTIENTIIRNRHFIGFDSIEWKSERIGCAKFGIKEEISVGSPNLGYQTFKAFTTEYYGKNIGLIYYEKNIDNTIRFAYQLADTTTMERLEKLFLERQQ